MPYHIFLWWPASGKKPEIKAPSEVEIIESPQRTWRTKLPVPPGILFHAYVFNQKFLKINNLHIIKIEDLQMGKGIKNLTAVFFDQEKPEGFTLFQDHRADNAVFEQRHLKFGVDIVLRIECPVEILRGGRKNDTSFRINYIVGNSFRMELETVLTNCPECAKSDCKSCGEELKTVLTNWQPEYEKQMRHPWSYEK